MVDYDNKDWVVDRKWDRSARKNLLDESEAQQGMNGKQCLAPRLQIGQIMKNKQPITGGAS
jgi:hypothetical protein